MYKYVHPGIGNESRYELDILKMCIIIEAFSESYPQLLLQSSIFFKDLFNNIDYHDLNIINTDQIIRSISICSCLISICIATTSFVQHFYELNIEKETSQGVQITSIWFTISRFIANILFQISKLLPLMIVLTKLNTLSAILIFSISNIMLILIKFGYFYLILNKYYDQITWYKKFLSIFLKTIIKTMGYVEKFNYSFNFLFFLFFNLIENLSFFMVYLYLDSFTLNYFNIVTGSIILGSFWISVLIEIIYWNLFVIESKSSNEYFSFENFFSNYIIVNKS